MEKEAEMSRGKDKWVVRWGGKNSQIEEEAKISDNG